MIYLGGPWQRFCADKYKDQIRERFPNQEFFDPEQYTKSDWFEKSIPILKKCDIMVAYMPSFLGFVVFQLGQFYTLHPNAKIIIIWPENINQISKRIFENIGTVVTTVDEAIEELKELL